MYLAYASTLQEIVPEEVCLHRFADDYSLKRSFKADNRKAEHSTISILQNCLKDVRLWMDENRLKMNEWKDRIYCVWSQETTGQMHNNWHWCEQY